MLRKRILTYAGLASAISLVALPALFVVGPSIGREDASATEKAARAAKSSEDAVSITATSTIPLALSPSMTESTFTTGSGSITVNSNTTDGYSVTMSTEESTLSYSGTKGPNSTYNIATIQPATSTGSSMAAPSWAYILGKDCKSATPSNCVSTKQNSPADLALTYSKVPGPSGTTLVDRQKGETEVTNQGETFYVGYGLKGAPAQVAGSYSRKVTYTLLARKAFGTLTVNPNGGTWTHDGQNYTEAQSFTKDEGTEMTLEAPSTNAHYTISYNANGQGATYNANSDTNTKAVRNFEGWTVEATAGGASTGSYNSTAKVYTFLDGNDTAKANYASSANFTLPAITKTGYSCQWAKGSASGAKSGGSSVTTTAATADVIYYAVCTQNTSGTVSFSGNNITFSPTSLNQINSNGGEKSVTVTPASGYYFSAQPTCDNANFAASTMTTGTSATAAQTVEIKYSGTVSGETTTCTFTVASSGASGALNQATHMQTVTSCPTSLTTGMQYTLKDKRDGKSYTVSKLADNKCWMTQNLALGGDKEMTLNKDASNVKEDGRTIPPSSESGFDDNGTKYVYIDSTYGGYYSYAAATAGSNPRPNSGTQDSTEDICPKGWRLPTKAEYDSLKSATGWSNKAAWMAAPFNGKSGGYYYGSEVHDRISYGRYWSSTSYGDSLAYNLVFDSSSANTLNSTKRYGFSVRCVFGS